MRRLIAPSGRLFFLLALVAGSAVAQTAAIQWNTTYQTMQGWGASTSYGAGCYGIPTETSANANLFWSTTSGIGLEWFRTSSSCDSSIHDGAWAAAAAANGAQLIYSATSPPASMMSDDTWAPPTSSGAYLLPSNYSAYAASIVSTLQSYQTTYGVTFYAVSVQNEPNTFAIWNPPGPACGVNSPSISQCLTYFVDNYLGPQMHTAFPNVKLAMPEDSVWFSTDYITTCMNDTTCAGYVSLIFSHDYDGANAAWGFTGNGSYCCATPTAPPSSIGSRPVWMTEVNGGFSAVGCNGNLWTFDASMADALVWAHNIWGFLTIPNASAYMYYDLWGTDASQGQCNDGLTDSNFNAAKRLYVFGNWSEFVRPGWVRIGATANPSSGVYVTAFKNSAGTQFAVVVINANSSTQPLTVSFSGVLPTSVTPYITDGGSNNLTAQSAIAVSSGSFSATLNASSVTTFVGNSSSTPQAATPTFSPSHGTYGPPQNVTISTTSSGAVICWNTTGSALATNGSSGCASGSTLYSGAILVSSTETIYAVAGGTGYTDSSTASSPYVITMPQAVMPTFSPFAGTYSSPQNVTISTTSSGAVICWNTTGSALATNGSSGCASGSTLYSGAILVSSTETIHAVAGGTGYTDSSPSNSGYVISSSGSSAFSTLTDGATVTWPASSPNAIVTLGGNRTLSITGASSGWSGTIIVKQDATGGRTLALPSNSYVNGGGAGVITLTSTANAQDKLTAISDGIRFYWDYNKNYTTSGGGGGTTPTRGAGNACVAYSSPLTCSLSVTSGQKILFHLSWGSGTAGTLTVTDNQSNTYTVLDGPNCSTSVGTCVEQGIATASATGTLTITATYSVSGGAGLAVESVNIFSGAVDQHALGTPTTTSTPTSPSVTTTAADYCWGGITDAGGEGSTLSAGSGWTRRDVNSAFPTADEDLTQTGAGSLAATWSYGATGKFGPGVVCMHP